MTSIKTFKPDSKILKTLTQNERKLLPILIEAAKKIDKVFLLQENNNYKGANFYPHDATKQEIEEAAQENPRILSPFTVVKRNTSGKLIAIDYYTEFAKLLAPIAKLFAKASEISENKSLKNYLKVMAKVLVNGDCQKADIAWLAVKNSNLDISIGCHERYLDKLFFIKRAYQANVGIIDKAKSEKAKVIRDILYNTIGQKPQRFMSPSIVDIRTQHCLVFVGFLGRALFTRQYLPSDSETIEGYGSRITGYLSSIDYKFEKLIYPIFNALFEKKFKVSYPKELLKTGNYFYVLLSAIAQQLHRYKNSRIRLKELFPIFDEANCVVSGIQHAKHLILKGVINQKELEAIMIAQICWTFSEWILSKKSNVREDYLKGDALTFNFLVREGALQEKEGISWPNFAKMFFEIENLATIFTRFLEEGSYLEAQEFLSRYLSFEPFKSFDQRLSKIKPI
jgi:hypothetical protein